MEDAVEGGMSRGWYAIDRTLLLPGSATEVMALIEDIESYPAFMDVCLAAQIEARGDNWVIARLRIRAGLLQEQLCTRNTQVPDGLDMEMVSGPLEGLEGQWRAHPLPGGGTRVSLRLRLQLHWSQRLLTHRVEAAIDRLLGLISERSYQLYEGF